MDLDQTSIHSESEGMFKFDEMEVQFDVKGIRFHFNIRHYCLQFSYKMSQHFNVYVFTAGDQKYAQVIINYLNRQKQTIIGFLHKKHCIKMNNSTFVKDLRIIENRHLKDIVMVDNLVQNFGLQIQNGIPILEFTDQKHNVQFKGIQQFLIQLSHVQMLGKLLNRDQAGENYRIPLELVFANIIKINLMILKHKKIFINLIQLKLFQTRMITITTFIQFSQIIIRITFPFLDLTNNYSNKLFRMPTNCSIQ